MRRGIELAAGPLGLFVYGVLNRLLLVTGLHHILNNVVWFIVGDFHGATGDYLQQPTGEPTRDLLAMARDGLAFKLRAAIRARTDVCFEL